MFLLRWLSRFSEFVCQFCYVCRLKLWIVHSQLWFHLELYSIMVLMFLLVLVLFLHATKCISRGLDFCVRGGFVGFRYISVAMTKSLFRIRVLVLLCVSIEIVDGVYSVMVPFGIIFHNGFMFPLGSCALLINVLCLWWFRRFSICFCCDG